MTDYYDIGLPFDDSDDLTRFTIAYLDRLKGHGCEGGCYATMDLGDGAELWYYGDEKMLWPQSLEMYHEGITEMEFAECRWEKFPENKVDSGLLHVFTRGGEKADFPLNILVVNAPLFYPEITEYIREGEYAVDFSLFARNIDIDKASEEAFGEKLSGEYTGMCIPCGTFPLTEDDENWEPSPTAIMAGMVKTAEKRRNRVTEEAYWRVEMSCLGYDFNVLIADEMTGNAPIMPGDVINGMFWLSGKIVDLEE